jgi:hypothetical protein
MSTAGFLALFDKQKNNLNPKSKKFGFYIQPQNIRNPTYWWHLSCSGIT